MRGVVEGWLGVSVITSVLAGIWTFCYTRRFLSIGHGEELMCGITSILLGISINMHEVV